MPIVMNIDKNSDDDAIQAAIGRCIRQLRREGGREPDQCAAICYALARKKTGKTLGEKRE